MVRITRNQNSDYKYMWKFDATESNELSFVNLSKVVGCPSWYRATFIDNETQSFYSEMERFSDYVIKDDGKNDIKGFFMNCFSVISANLKIIYLE